MALTVAFNQNFHIFILKMFQISITILFYFIITLFYGLKSFIFQNLCINANHPLVQLKKKSSKEKNSPILHVGFKPPIFLWEITELVNQRTCFTGCIIYSWIFFAILSFSFATEVKKLLVGNPRKSYLNMRMVCNYKTFSDLPYQSVWDLLSCGYLWSSDSRIFLSVMKEWRNEDICNNSSPNDRTINIRIVLDLPG